MAPASRSSPAIHARFISLSHGTSQTKMSQLSCSRQDFADRPDWDVAAQAKRPGLTGLGRLPPPTSLIMVPGSGRSQQSSI